MLRDDLIQVTVRSHEPQSVMQDLIKAKLSELENDFVRRTPFTQPVSVVFTGPRDSVVHLESNNKAADLINPRLAKTSLLLHWILARSLNPRPQPSAEKRGKGKRTNPKISFQTKLANLQSKLSRNRAKTETGELTKRMDEAILGEQRFRRKIDRLFSKQRQQNLNARSGRTKSPIVLNDDGSATETSQLDNSKNNIVEDNSTKDDHNLEENHGSKLADNHDEMTADGAKPTASPKPVDTSEVTVSPKGDTASESMLDRLRKELCCRVAKKVTEDDASHRPDESNGRSTRQKIRRPERSSTATPGNPRRLGHEGNQVTKA